METVAAGFGLVEAPRADAAGNVYFSDVTQGGVYRLAPDGARSTVVPKRRGIGGLVLHADGGVVVSGRDVVHVRDGERRAWTFPASWRRRRACRRRPRSRA